MDASALTLICLGKALAFYTTFGKHRQHFPNHYDCDWSVYIVECKPETKARLEQGEWIENLLFRRCKEKDQDGLVAINGKNYFVREACPNISKSSYFVDSLTSQNFTDAVEEILDRIELLDPEQLLTHLTRDGTYIVKLAVGTANHNFLLLKEVNMINLVHYPGRLISITRDQEDFAYVLREFIQGADSGLSLFGVVLPFDRESATRIVSVKFSPYYPSQSDVIIQLGAMANQYFSNRPEHAHIQELVEGTSTF